MEVKNICFIDYDQKRDCFPIQFIQEIEKEFDVNIYTFTFKPVIGLNERGALLLFTREVGGIIPKSEVEKAKKIAAKYNNIFVTINIEKEYKSTENFALYRPIDYIPEDGYIEKVSYISLPNELRKKLGKFF